MTDASLDSSQLDAAVDAEIAQCIDLTNPRSFFLFAGAGSGKTRSLITALNHLRAAYGEMLRRRGQKIGVITYTNAACDEIIRRAEFDRLIHVSTIHSFAWSLIDGFDRDIRIWIERDLVKSIAELRADEAKGRPGTKASATRLVNIASRERRLANLPTIRRFIYSPTGDNRTRDSLNHAEVLRITAAFLNEKPTLGKVVASRFPYIFIDECQDTNKALVEALFGLEQAHRGAFGLGLLGDTMQRIYADGKPNIEASLPPEWARPAKQLNHRCPKRIVELVNRIRSAADNQVQIPRTDNPDGLVRVFCLPADTSDKSRSEANAANLMADFTGDPSWTEPERRKTLILEHHMAATRMGFAGVFGALLIDDFRTGLLDGTLPAMAIFSHVVLPFARAHQAKDKFALAKIVRENSPLLSKEALRNASQQKDQLGRAGAAAEALGHVLEKEEPTLRELAQTILETGLFELPDIVAATLAGVASLKAGAEQKASDERADPAPERVAAIEAFLKCRFSEIAPYAAYVSGTAPFDTHQGVKGLEFPRVMVVIDDTEARGFMFKYDKLFTDANTPVAKSDDKESTADRTRRLFYVTCSRAEKSLAIVAYTADPKALAERLGATGWFNEEEICLTP